MYPPLLLLGASCVVSCACSCTYLAAVLSFVRLPALQLRVSDEYSSLLSTCFVLGRVCAVPCLFVLAQPLLDSSSLSGAVLPHCCFSWAARLLRLGTRTSGLWLSFHLLFSMLQALVWSSLAVQLAEPGDLGFGLRLFVRVALSPPPFYGCSWPFPNEVITPRDVVAPGLR